MPQIPFAAQLYTVRELTKVDFVGTVREIARLGYEGVELAGFGNLASAGEVRQALEDAGLSLVGVHTGIEALEKDLSGALDEHAALGNHNVIVPWMPEARRKDGAGWKQAAESLTRIAAACHQRGFQLAYHNHSFEFERFTGAEGQMSGMDLLLAHSDPALVKVELDVYWVEHGHENPAAYLERLGGRVLSLHLKDMAAGPDRQFAPVGAGILDFPAILAAAGKHGVQNYVVEQDTTYSMPPLESLRISLENLRKIA